MLRIRPLAQRRKPDVMGMEAALPPRILGHQQLQQRTPRLKISPRGFGSLLQARAGRKRMRLRTLVRRQLRELRRQPRQPIEHSRRKRPLELPQTAAHPGFKRPVQLRPHLGLERLLRQLPLVERHQLAPLLTQLQHLAQQPHARAQVAIPVQQHRLQRPIEPPARLSAQTLAAAQPQHRPPRRLRIQHLRLLHRAQRPRAAAQHR